MTNASKLPTAGLGRTIYAAPMVDPDDQGGRPSVAGFEGSRHGPELTESVVRVRRDRISDGGLQMYYQPVLDLRTGQIHYLEALARLAVEDGRVLLPGDFLPYLSGEEVNLLFQSSVEQAIEQLAVWDALGYRLRVSVNISPSTLLNPDCTQWVASVLDRHKIAPHRLVVELLEDRVEDVEIQRRTFNALRSLGIGMAMDDLGAGHSSLRRLTALAFSIVKIDRLILAQLRVSPLATVTFLAAVKQVGRDMGWQVVAEGLEDVAITEVATILGIPCGQGYHLARPMHADRVPGWLAAFRPPPLHGSIRTFPGAVAYHWQFAGLGSPHPGQLDTCPMTALLAGEPSAVAAMDWHQQQHAGAADDFGSSAELLLQWLTEQSQKTNY